MEKPYGYKTEDMIAFAEFIASGGLKGKPLAQGFRDYAALSGKAAGSVRNLYYALAGFSRKNAEFTAKYLGGKTLKVDKSEKFSVEESKILEKIAEFTARGVSVRRATVCLAGGDAKKALRYQNKYRNELKRAAMAEDYCAKGGESQGGVDFTAREFVTARLKKEINRLADRLAFELKRENAALISEISALKAENGRLYERLNGKEGRAAGYFGRNAAASRAKYLNP